MVDNSVLNRLRECDTATICNVIELFEIRPRNRGFMNRQVSAAFPDLPPMVGFAATATCRTFVEPPNRQVPIVPDLISGFDELDGPAVVVMQNLDTHGEAAIFGDVLCNSFKAFGAVGLVTDGAGRDFEQVELIDFPVFSNGIVCSHGYMHLLEVNVPIQVGGISVDPNTLLHGDANGVTTIPIEIAADIPDACVEFAAAEAVVIDQAQSGSTNLAELREAYGEMARLAAELGARLRRS